MQSQRIIGVFLIVVGVVLLVLGIRAADSFASQLSNLFTGSPTDRAMWLTMGGVVAILAGAAAAILPSRAVSR